MKKTFSDDLEQIEVELIDKDKNRILKKAKFLSVKECKKMSKMFNNASIEKNGERSFEILQEIMVNIFGGTINEYEKYSPGLIKDVLSYITAEMINPTKQVQEKIESEISCT